MPPLSDDRFHDLLELIGDLRKQTQQLEITLPEKLAMLLSNYREDVYRTTMGIHHRLLSYEDQLRADSRAREARQKELDAQLGAIRHNQQLWIRIVMALALIGIGIMIAYWLL